MNNIDFKKIKNIYFVGIGGIGVSAIARMMIEDGKKVGGSDFVDSEIIENLRKLGAMISIGQKVTDIPKDTDLIIYTTAIAVADKEFFGELKKIKIPSISYAEALGLISKDKFTVAVSGTHGKTTTTGMIAKILIDAGLDPTVIIGSIFKETNSNFIAGKSEYLVLEVDEYQRKFLSVFPRILVINNIDEDHLDYFKDLSDIQSAFAGLVANVSKGGMVVTDLNNLKIQPAIENSKVAVIDYSSVPIDDLKLKFPGEHNRQNAKAALAVAGILGIDLKKAIISLNNFSGTWRRFEYLGKTKGGALVYDDYAHNPQKIQAVLSGVKELYPNKKIIAVFQPHLYSRTKTLLSDFAKSFNDADAIILAPIFPARELPDSTISSEILADLIKKNYSNKMVACLSTFDDIVVFLNKEAKDNDIVITIGAGDIYKINNKIIKNL